LSDLSWVDSRTRPVIKQRLGEWQTTWKSVGKADIAKALASPAYNILIDDTAFPEKRELARKWLAESVLRDEREKTWNNRRSWIAIALSILSVLIIIIWNTVRN
jgi:hypothetical protein